MFCGRIWREIDDRDLDMYLLNTKSLLCCFWNHTIKSSTPFIEYLLVMLSSLTYKLSKKWYTGGYRNSSNTHICIYGDCQIPLIGRRYFLHNIALLYLRWFGLVRFVSGHHKSYYKNTVPMAYHRMIWSISYKLKQKSLFEHIL